MDTQLELAIALGYLSVEKSKKLSEQLIRIDKMLSALIRNLGKKYKDK